MIFKISFNYVIIIIKLSIQTFYCECLFMYIIIIILYWNKEKMEKVIEKGHILLLNIQQL